MPYIDPQTRDRLSDPDLPPRARLALNAGELTYQLQQVLLAYIKGHELKYQTLAECLGALEGAKLDLIERVVKPYEERKCEDNGDVWPDRDAVHTCSAECPCHTGGTPTSDFLPDNTKPYR